MDQLEAETLAHYVARMMSQTSLRIVPDFQHSGEYIIRLNENAVIRYPWQFVLELLANVLAGQQANGPRHDTK